MRAFADKLKPSQPEARSLSLAVQRLIQANAKELNGGLATKTSIRFPHDFSRVPLHVNADTTAWSKFTTGAPGDRYEQEADRAAEQVTRMPERAEGSSEHGRESNQAVQCSDRPLSSQERAFFEPRFGHDFSRVRIHADARSAKMADGLNAEAFTVGHNVYFGPGKLHPQIRGSDQLLAHELAHVAQQSRMGLALQSKLKITGKAGDVSRAITLLNSGLRQCHVSVDKSGNVSLTKSFVELSPNAQQQALADRLTTVINDAKDVIMIVSSGSTTLGGSYATGDFDIADLETYGVAGLIHEIEEQYQKQVKSLAFGSETTGAHSKAIEAESEVRGAKRGAQKVISSTVNADGTLDAIIEIPHTFPDGKVKTMVMTVKSNNIVSVTWK